MKKRMILMISMILGGYDCNAGIVYEEELFFPSDFNNNSSANAYAGNAYVEEMHFQHAKSADDYIKLLIGLKKNNTSEGLAEKNLVAKTARKFFRLPTDIKTLSFEAVFLCIILQHLCGLKDNEDWSSSEDLIDAAREFYYIPSNYEPEEIFRLVDLERKLFSAAENKNHVEWEKRIIETREVVFLKEQRDFVFEMERKYWKNYVSNVEDVDLFKLAFGYGCDLYGRETVPHVLGSSLDVFNGLCSHKEMTT